jgi:hypothetical protein
VIYTREVNGYDTKDESLNNGNQWGCNSQNVIQLKYLPDQRYYMTWNYNGTKFIVVLKCHTGSVTPHLPIQSSICTEFRSTLKGDELRASLRMWKSLKDSKQND